jgi:predicted kinase
MIIFLNGPFGVGKSSVAKALASRLPRSVIFDPEELGAKVGRLQPEHTTTDWQDAPLWRELVIEGLRNVKTHAPSSIVIVPMTVWRRNYLEELIRGLAAFSEVRCFQLTASEQTLRDRITGRPDSEGPHDWCLAHLATGLAMSGDETFGEQIDTEARTPDQIANDLATIVIKGSFTVREGP